MATAEYIYKTLFSAFAESVTEKNITVRNIIKTHYPLHAKLRHSSLHLIFTFNSDHEHFVQSLMSSLHLLLGLPRVRLPSIIPSNVARIGSVDRLTWPYHFNFLIFISSTIGFSLVTSHRYVNGIFSMNRPSHDMVLESLYFFKQGWFPSDCFAPIQQTW